MFILVLIALVVAFLTGFWYRGWVHNITITDQAGEYLGG